jgi:hypothetical protein
MHEVSFNGLSLAAQPGRVMTPRPATEQLVTAAVDGLAPYRRLLAACAERLDDDAAVLIQLHRQVLEATVAELPRLEASLDYELAA